VWSGHSCLLPLTLILNRKDLNNRGCPTLALFAKVGTPNVCSGGINPQHLWPSPFENHDGCDRINRIGPEASAGTPPAGSKAKGWIVTYTSK
jgi:hypothetical protein